MGGQLPELVKIGVYLAKEMDGVRAGIRRSQLSFSWIGENSRLKQPLIGSFGCITHLVYSGAVPGL